MSPAVPAAQNRDLLTAPQAQRSATKQLATGQIKSVVLDGIHQDHNGILVKKNGHIAGQYGDHHLRPGRMLDHIQRGGVRRSTSRQQLASLIE